MIEPYKMVFVNVIASLLVLISVLLYKFVFPKKKINLFYLLIIISIIPIISIFRTGAYESGDFNIHVRRSMEFFMILSEGNLMPTWAGDLNATYGYPLFAFNYTLPYYLISLFHLIGFSFIASLKLFLASNFILSGVFMYLFSKNFFKNNLAAFSASIFYLFNPYHLISLHFKITIGEILAYTLIPLVFYFGNRYLSDKKIINLLLSGLFLGLVMLSHIFVGIFLLPVLILFLIFQTKSFWRGTFYSICAISVSLLISMYQWAAPLIYRPYLYTTFHFSDPTKNFYFPNIIDLLYSPWRLGFLFQGPKGELSFLLGYAQLVGLLIIIFLVLKNRIKKEHRKIVLLWITLFFTAVFLITPYSIPVWRLLPILNQAGSQRLLIIAALLTSLFAGYISLNLDRKNWLICSLILFAIGTTILNWGQRRVIPAIDDTVLRSNLSQGTQWADTHFYALPKWVDPKNQWFSEVPKQNIEVLNGQATITALKRTSTNHSYLVDAKTPLFIRENTLYYPGWSLTDNGKPVTIFPGERGIINFKIPSGRQNLTLSYNDIPIYKLLKMISALSFSFLLGTIGIPLIINFIPKSKK